MKKFLFIFIYLFILVVNFQCTKRLVPHKYVKLNKSLRQSSDLLKLKYKKSKFNFHQKSKKFTFQPTMNLRHLLGIQSDEAIEADGQNSNIPTKNTQQNILLATIVQDFKLLKTDKSSIEIPELQDKQLVLNKYSLYYTSPKDDKNYKDYQSIEGSLQIGDIYSPQDDDIVLGVCCMRIHDVQEKMGHQCFDIDLPKVIWTICHQDQKIVTDFREKLILTVTASYLDQRGITQIKPYLTGLAKQPIPNNWSFDNQEQWTGQCIQKGIQSPIALKSPPKPVPGETAGPSQQGNEFSQPSMSIKIRWHYEPTKDAAFVYDGHQKNLIGDFGALIFEQNHGLQEFKAEKIAFKFPAEHTLDDKKADVELIVYHSNPQGQKAILSIFLFGKDGAEQNRFLTDFNLEKCPSEDQCIENDICLNKLAPDDWKQYFIYEGQDTQPPCAPAKRIILQESFEIAISQLEQLKNCILSKSSESSQIQSKSSESSQILSNSKQLSDEQPPVTSIIIRDPTCSSIELENINQIVKEECPEKKDGDDGDDDDDNNVPPGEHKYVRIVARTNKYMTIDYPKPKFDSDGEEIGNEDGEEDGSENGDNGPRETNYQRTIDNQVINRLLKPAWNGQKAFRDLVDNEVAAQKERNDNDDENGYSADGINQPIKLMKDKDLVIQVQVPCDENDTDQIREVPDPIQESDLTELAEDQDEEEPTEPLENDQQNISKN